MASVSMATAVSMAAARRSASKPLLLDAVTPRRLGNVTPNALQGAASTFHNDSEFTTPKSNRGGRSPVAFFTPRTPSTTVAQFRLHSTTPFTMATCAEEGAGEKSCAGCTPTSRQFTPRSASAVAAAQRLSISMASCEEEAVLGGPKGVYSLAAPSMSGGGYPRLLGRGAADTSAVTRPRRVRFSEEPQEMAQSAREACLAMQQRVASRTVNEPYPRLLGRAPVTSTAAMTMQRRMHFSVEPQTPEESARAACVAFQQRIAARRLIKRA